MSRLLLEADELNRGVETLADEAHRAIESLQEHAQRLDRGLHTMESRVGDLLKEIASLQSRAEALRQTIGDTESGANPELLVQLEELLARLHERRRLLGHWQDVAREWMEVTRRCRRLGDFTQP